MPKQMKPPASIGVEPAAEDRNQSTDIILQPGTCANCRERIRLLGGLTNCPLCAAWRRWYSARRIMIELMRRTGR